LRGGAGAVRPGPHRSRRPGRPSGRLRGAAAGEGRGDRPWLFATPSPSRSVSSGNRYHLIACPGGRYLAAADDGHVRAVEIVAGQAGGDQPLRRPRAAAHAQVVEVSFPRDRLPGEGEGDRLVYDLDRLELDARGRQELLGSGPERRTRSPRPSTLNARGVLSVGTRPRLVRRPATPVPVRACSLYLPRPMVVQRRRPDAAPEATACCAPRSDRSRPGGNGRRPTRAEQLSTGPLRNSCAGRPLPQGSVVVGRDRRPPPA
jgi:hypothetical protein